jgi:hypothetical protein
VELFQPSALRRLVLGPRQGVGGANDRDQSLDKTTDGRLVLHLASQRDDLNGLCRRYRREEQAHGRDGDSYDLHARTVVAASDGTRPTIQGAYRQASGRSATRAHGSAAVARPIRGKSPTCNVAAMSDSPRTVAWAMLLTWVTLALVVATVALVIVTRQGSAQARAAARDELDLLQRQFGAGHRPLLVDVLTTAQIPSDMGATRHHAPALPPTIETSFPGFEPERFDPRAVFVKFQGGMIYISAPLRNVGRGLAVIDGSGVGIVGDGSAHAERQTIQGYHVPVGETTRIDLIMRYVRDDTIGRGTQWVLTVPYVDFAGQQRTVAKIEIVNGGRDVHGPWRIERVDQESVEPPTATAMEPSGWSVRVRRFLS